MSRKTCHLRDPVHLYKTFSFRWASQNWRKVFTRFTFSKSSSGKRQPIHKSAISKLRAYTSEPSVLLNSGVSVGLNISEAESTFRTPSNSALKKQKTASCYLFRYAYTIRSNYRTLMARKYLLCFDYSLNSNVPVCLSNKRNMGRTFFNLPKKRTPCYALICILLNCLLSFLRWTFQTWGYVYVSSRRLSPRRDWTYRHPTSSKNWKNHMMFKQSAANILLLSYLKF